MSSEDVVTSASCAEETSLSAATGAGEPDTERIEDNKRPSNSKPTGLLNRCDTNKSLQPGLLTYEPTTLIIDYKAQFNPKSKFWIKLG
jgi:hypothetical protein